MMMTKKYQQVPRVLFDAHNSFNRFQESMLMFTTISIGSKNSCCSQQHQQVPKIHVDVHYISRFQEFMLMFRTSTDSKISYCSQQHQQVLRIHVDIHNNNNRFQKCMFDVYNHFNRLKLSVLFCCCFLSHCFVQDYMMTSVHLLIAST